MWYSVIVLFNDTDATDIYTLSLHDALPISMGHTVTLGNLVSWAAEKYPGLRAEISDPAEADILQEDRKSTRLNSSHANISYAVFCLKKKSDIVDVDRQRCGVGAQVMPGRDE